MSGLRPSAMLLVAAAAAAGAAFPASGVAAPPLPSPCPLLAATHAEAVLGRGTSLAVSQRRSLHERLSGVPMAMCSEIVGGDSIALMLSTARRGVEMVGTVRSQTRLSGPGSGATLTVYTSHGVVGYTITFRRGVAPARAPTYASITLARASHLAALEALARRVYEEL